MSLVANWMVRFFGWFDRRALEYAAENPAEAQLMLLQNILQKNKATAFGQEHRFPEITDHAAYQSLVPMRGYQEMEPYVQRMTGGERHVLTATEPFMYETTSGTTRTPKLIPVTQRWKQQLSSLMRVWLNGCLRDHPGVFRHRILTITSPAIEGYTENKVPMGSVSGLTRMRAPWILRRGYCTPYNVSEIADYDLRYFVTMRLALATRLSALVTPNPSTIIRLAELGQKHADTMIESIHEGHLGVSADIRESLSEDQQKNLRRIERKLRPNPARAGFLASIVRKYGTLIPRYVWPELAIIGCWLGGSAGIQAETMRSFFSPTLPIRDLGFRATEGTMTIPLSDHSASGVLALHANFYEFIAEDDIDEENPRVWMAHELELGGKYYFLLTTIGGLYRYDINDVVQVTGFYKKAPIIAFLRKGRDMVNITGEKLHLNQIIDAAMGAASDTSVPWNQLQLIPDTEASRYDLLLEPSDAKVAPEALRAFAEQFDRKLMEFNIEYEQKRKSDRLAIPRLFEMKTGWSERRRKRDIDTGGKRDAQYKWPVIELAWDEASRTEVMRTLDPASS